MDKQLLLSRERLQQAFQQFDSDGSGKITNEELAKVIDVFLYVVFERNLQSVLRRNAALLLRYVAPRP